MHQLANTLTSRGLPSAIGGWKKCYAQNKAAPFILVTFIGAPLSQTIYGMILMNWMIEAAKDPVKLANSWATMLIGGIFAGMGIGGLHVVGNEQGSAGTPLPDGVMIPVNSIEKAPSAELRPGQKDSDSLPEYALLDQVLAMYIEHAHGRADLLADGFDEATVDTVMRLVDRAEWKRRQYPLGPKVTALAFGRDRRLPVTNAFRE